MQIKANGYLLDIFHICLIKYYLEEKQTSTLVTVSNSTVEQRRFLNVDYNKFNSHVWWNM